MYARIYVSNVGKLDMMIRLLVSFAQTLNACETVDSCASTHHDGVSTRGAQDKP